MGHVKPCACGVFRWLQSNHISGTLPAGWSDLRGLDDEVVMCALLHFMADHWVLPQFFNENRISGSIPSSWGYMGMLGLVSQSLHGPVWSNECVT